VPLAVTEGYKTCVQKALMQLQLQTETRRNKPL